MVIHKTRKKHKYKKRRTRRRKKYIIIGGSLKDNFVKDEKDKLIKEIESLKKSGLSKEQINAKAKLALQKYKEQIQIGIKDMRKGDLVTGSIWTIGSLTLGLIPLLYRLGVGAVLAPAVRSFVNTIVRKTIGDSTTALKQLERLEKLEPIMKEIDKDIKNNMSFINLKKKYIETDIDKLLGSKSLDKAATSVVKNTALKRIKHKQNADLLLPYIYYKLSKTNKAKAAKLENKSGNLFYKVNITKDGILKFNTAGPLIAPSYKVSNLFTRGRFTTWGGKKRRRRTKRRRTRKRKRTKRN